MYCKNFIWIEKWSTGIYLCHFDDFRFVDIEDHINFSTLADLIWKGMVTSALLEREIDHFLFF